MADDAAILLDLIAETLRRDVIPTLDGAAGYQARLAAAMADTLARERRLGRVEDDPALTAAIRDGRAAIDDPSVASVLWRMTLARLAIDQPRYDATALRA